MPAPHPGDRKLGGRRTVDRLPIALDVRLANGLAIRNRSRCNTPSFARERDAEALELPVCELVQGSPYRPTRHGVAQLRRGHLDENRHI